MQYIPIIAIILVGTASHILANNSNQTTKQLGLIFPCIELREMIDSLQDQFNTFLPPGFIYVQFSGRPDPVTIFPIYNWADVTSEFSGQFFRAEGSLSAPLGTLQAESSPKIERVDSTRVPVGTALTSVTDVADGTSGNMFMSTEGGGSLDGITISAEGYGTEVRPTNQAIKIWKRV